MFLYFIKYAFFSFLNSPIIKPYITKGFNLFMNSVFEEIGHRKIELFNSLQISYVSFEKHKYPRLRKFPSVCDNSKNGLRFCTSSSFHDIRNSFIDKLLVYVHKAVKQHKNSFGGDAVPDRIKNMDATDLSNIVYSLLKNVCFFFTIFGNSIFFAIFRNSIFFAIFAICEILFFCYF